MKSPSDHIIDDISNNETENPQIAITSFGYDERKVNEIHESVKCYEKLIEYSYSTDKSYVPLDYIDNLLERTKDEISILNRIEFKYEPLEIARELYDFLNHGYVAQCCLIKIAEVMKIKINFGSEKTYFSEKGEGVTDRDYFKFLRSLISAHPDNTNKMGGETMEHIYSCPYAVWEGFPEQTAKARVFVFSKKGADSSAPKEYETEKILIINTLDLFEFLKDLLDWCLEKISIGFTDYISKRVKKFKREPLKIQTDDYPAFLHKLIDEMRKRGVYESRISEIEECIDIFNYNESQINKKLFEEYREDIRSAIDEVYDLLQNMQLCTLNNGGTENNPLKLRSIIYPTINNISTRERDITGRLNRLLDGELIEKECIRYEIFECDLFGRFVKITDDMSNEELYILCKVDLYFRMKEEMYTC